jgi:hypothetical protein
MSRQKAPAYSDRLFMREARATLRRTVSASTTMMHRCSLYFRSGAQVPEYGSAQACRAPSRFASRADRLWHRLDRRSRNRSLGTSGGVQFLHCLLSERVWCDHWSLHFTETRLASLSGGARAAHSLQRSVSLRPPPANDCRRTSKEARNLSPLT